jgi:hypothetical protein
MAAGPLTQITDIVVPEIFTPYVQQLTSEKSNLIQSGALADNGLLSGLLGGGGLTFNIPSMQDLDSDADNVSTDDVSDVVAADYGGGTPATRLDATPFKIGTNTEIAVRLSRNAHWGSADLAQALAGTDPMGAIASRVANYWARRLQAAFVATWTGVIANNTSADSGDYTNDITGTFADGVTNFSAEAFLDATVTMTDSSEDLGIVMVHPIVHNRMKKNNLIDFIPDARGEVNIPTFLGHIVVSDAGMPVSTQDYDTWIFGPGATQLGMSTPRVGTEVSREALSANGGGNEFLSSRVEWAIHPVGHAYVGTAADGGPGNGAGANDLAAAGSWDRRRPERNQIKFARLVTTEA